MTKIRALKVLNRFIEFHPKRVIDVGSGKGAAAEHMRGKGIEVTTIDNRFDANFKATYITHLFLTHDGIWCSHVLEHCFNIQETLLKFKRELLYNGILAITVPPMREKLVGGHLHNFTPGTLIYNLVMAGFDCSDAIVYVDDVGNISVIVKNVDMKLPAELVSGPGDLEKLNRYFPCEVFQDVDGQFGNINWGKK